MNNVVKSPEESDFPKMHLAVVMADGINHMESPYHFSPQEEELNIAFVNPYSKEEFEDDIQYVMEIDGPAEFLEGGSIGCDGNRRLSARMFDSTPALLKIHDSSATIRVWAGWATGQNAVRLTPDLMLEPQKGTEEAGKIVDEHGREEVEVSNKVEEVELVSEPENPLVADEGHAAVEDTIDNEKSLNESDLSANEQVAAKNFQRKPKGTLGDNSLRDDPLLVGHMKENKQHHKHVIKLEKEKRQQEIDNLKEKIKDMHPFHQAKEIHKTILDSHTNLHKHFGYGTREDSKSFREKYESDSFANGLDTQRHMVASIFFLLAMGSIVFFYGKRRGVKGRRDL
eukprot:scaffold1184_cov132-Cylindrotheca_fusiformis.AAC.39